MKRAILIGYADAGGRPERNMSRVTVAIVRWRGLEDLFSITLKQTLSYRPDAGRPDGGEPLIARPATEPLPWMLDTVSELPGAAPSELRYSSDFVFYKAYCDVLLHGHANSIEPEEQLVASIRIGALDRSFVVATTGPPARRAPLIAAAIRGEFGEQTQPVGPVRSAHRETDNDAFSAFDFGMVQSAAVAQQVDVISPDALLELDGLTAAEVAIGGTDVEVQLPGILPWVEVEGRFSGATQVGMKIDTLWLDTDRQNITLLWRGVYRAETADGRDIAHIRVALEYAQAPRSRGEILTAIAKGHFGFAWTEEDVRANRTPTGSGARLRAARYRALAEATEPTLTIEQYATISAELAEQRQPRVDVLSKYDLTEDTWLIEERGWLQRMGTQAEEGAATLAAYYGELFVEAQDALATPGEKGTVEQYAEMLARLETSEDHAKTLEEAEVTLARWMRTQRHWTTSAQEDEALATRISALVNEALAQGKVNNAKERSQS